LDYLLPVVFAVCDVGRERFSLENDFGGVGKVSVLNIQAFAPLFEQKYLY
jgi:hypothetical protein